ncbi:MAG TPA: heme ABC exporter ATP-binding protein CcmA, partial [Microthrixaceae bacterium]|nr:heme ABC exporter ATP-binding protein CcmA [Microthrixaceae bacterium]
LSAGQRRRGSFAAMGARRPELWLLDEPHAGLDASGRDIIDGLVREAASVGATVLFASHELDRADDVADRTVEVVGGTVVPAPLLEAPSLEAPPPLDAPPSEGVASDA